MPLPFSKPLSLGDIMRHIGADDTRIRCLVEGEEVLDARHVICCGVKASTTESVTVQGLCVQTSYVQKEPHELQFIYGLDGTMKGHCSCKAGNSQRCKHLVAMLLLAHRVGIQNLETLTSTDLKQAWGKLKATPMYQARELQELCHVQAVPRLRLTSDEQDGIRRRLIAGLPQSALALHFNGRQPERAPISANATVQEQALLNHMMEQNMSPYTEMLFHDVAFSSAVKLKIYKFAEEDLTEAERQFYYKHVMVSHEEAVQISAQTRCQTNTKWHRERKVRITGSKCHSYFTFIPKESNTWEMKVSKMMTESFRGNNATKYGKASEAKAIEAYSGSSHSTVERMGFVVHPCVPWLGYSPDGIIFRKGEPAILLEIKSPILGKTRKASELVEDKKLPYMKKENENFILNPRHCYYSQVQLGMFLLNLRTTDFMVYSQVEPLTIPVHRCDEYIDRLVRKLQFVYFKCLLPRLAG